MLKWKIDFLNFLLFFRFEQLRENLRVKEDNTSNYEYDNSTSEECNELMEWMESGTFTNIIWSIFKVTKDWRLKKLLSLAYLRLFLVIFWLST